MTKLSVPGMSCGHCKATVEKSVVGIDADAQVDVDLESRTVVVESSVTDAALIDALKAGGYEATVV